MDLLENLNWRYATKKFNGEKKVSADKLDYILEAARLAPSSSGLQPFKIFVVTDQAIKEQMKDISMGQSQVVDASHVLVFASWDHYSLERMESVFNYTLKERGLPLTTMDDYKKLLWSMYEPLSTDWHAQHAAKQAYISLGIAMVAAAEQKVDATPMEGFIPEKMDELLGLKEYGLKSAFLLPLGYRDTENDWLVNMKKVRTPKEDFIVEV